MRRHGPLLGLILLAVGLLYANVTQAPFCGYDDFHEAYRAAFFDGKVPSRIVTAVHYSPFMYRPVTSALQLATWQLFDHNPLGFRLRDLAMHLVAIASVYGIAFMIGRSRAAAAAAALLFGFSPLANEAVVVAIWTNTTAYALLLLSFFLFLCALRANAAGRAWAPALTGSFVLAFVATFTYEPTIVVFGLMLLYLAVCRAPGTLPSRRFLVAFGCGLGLDVIAFFGIRHAIGVTSTDMLALGDVAHDTLEYLVALVLPVDVVLGNAVFGVPLPVAEEPVPFATLLPGLAYAVVLAIAFVLGAARSPGARLSREDLHALGFLLVSIPLSLVPILLYKPHVSEFNLYVPSALYATAVALLLARVSRNRTVFAVLAGLLLVPYVAGDWVRNGRVIACARVASAIVAGLPVGAWREGDWYVRLATPPGQTLPPRYGVYNSFGTKTLEVVDTRIKGAQEAARLASGNDSVRLDIVDAPALAHGCARPKTCFYVSAEGAVKEVVTR